MLMLQQQMTEVSNLKHTENSRPMQEQATIVNQEQKNVETRAEQVNHKENADNQSQKYDARDKSNNEYHGGAGGDSRRRNKSDGTVKLKSVDNGGFDMKI
jgi:hypothetical protein